MTMEMTIIEVWRFAYAVVAIFTFVWLIVDFRKRTQYMTTARLYLTFSLAAFLLATIATSLESFFQQDNLSIRTPLYTAALAWCIFGLWVSRSDDT